MIFEVCLTLLQNAELFAKTRHSGMVKKDGTTTHSQHLEDVVNRLKSLGVVDEEVLCAGWLHDTLENTDTSFDDLFEQFGSRIAVLVSYLTKDASLPRKQRVQAYVRQLEGASYEAKLIKLCDISANLGALKRWNCSKSQRMRTIRQTRRYAGAIRDDLVSSQDHPGVHAMLEGIGQTFRQSGQKAAAQSRGT